MTVSKREEMLRWWIYEARREGFRARRKGEPKISRPFWPAQISLDARTEQNASCGMSDEAKEAATKGEQSLFEKQNFYYAVGDDLPRGAQTRPERQALNTTNLC